MRLVTLFLTAAFAASTVDAASYQKTDGTIVDPTMIHHGEPHSYSGANLEPDADLEGADLTKAHLSQANLIKANLTGANLYGTALVDADLSNAYLGGDLVVAADPVAPGAATGLATAIGPFAGRLSNGGQEIRLVNRNDRRLSVIDYNDNAPWPAGADRTRFTLARIDQYSAVELAEKCPPESTSRLTTIQRTHTVQRTQRWTSNPAAFRLVPQGQA